MINEHYLNMLSNKSVIRTLSEYATARGKEVGYENVFDFSLGNPSVPAPQSFKDVSISLLETMEPLKLHGYSPTLGIPEVKEKVAASLNRRFGMNYTGNHIFATSGAAGALAHALRAVTKPGDEVLVFAPYFPEYNPYINDTGARIKVVPADLETFQINFAEAEKYLTENVAAVLINTPNNPSGVLYSEETLEKLADLLTNIKDEAKTKREAAKEEKDTRVQAVKDSRSEELKELKKAQKEQENTLKEQNDKELKLFRQAKNDELSALKESNNDKLSELKKYNQKALKELQASITEQKKALENGIGETASEVEVTSEMYAQAAELSNQAIIDMAGFAKQNYTMLDNLKLGKHHCRAA